MAENKLRDSDDDEYINVYELLFREAETTEDLVLVLYHENRHSYQEARIEKDHGRGVWTQGAKKGLTYKPGITRPVSCGRLDYEYEGDRFIPAMEVDAYNAALSLQIGSAKFHNIMTVNRDQVAKELNWSGKQSCQQFFYPLNYQWKDGSPWGYAR